MQHLYPVPPSVTHSAGVLQSALALQIPPHPLLWPQLSAPQTGTQQRLLSHTAAPLAQAQVPPQESVVPHTPPSQVGVQHMSLSHFWPAEQ